ncbi:MAG: hypothetical protein IT381_00115 [Deltaproteobacteria bacterium]|nr:hypothetical protein [Deltaproteobacteria bacterium]
MLASNKTTIVLAATLALQGGCKPESRPIATKVTGQAVALSPIVSAQARALLLHESGPEVLSETLTDAEGKFELDLKDAIGTVVIEIVGTAGGETKEPISGNAVQLSYTDRFATILAGVKPGKTYDGIQVSVWSTLIEARARWDIEKNGRPADEALVDTVSLFTSHFGGVPFIDGAAPPLDPSAGPVNGLSSGAVHGFLTTAVAAMGNELSRRLRLTEGIRLNTVSTTMMLADDLCDGVFDGVGKSGKIIIVDEEALDLEASRLFLAGALGTFMTSDKNRSGLALSDLTALINAVASDTSILYGLKPSIAVSEGDGPKITLTGPISGNTLRDQVVISGKAESPSGVAGVEIFLDDNKMSGGDRQSVSEVTWALTSELTDGFHVVKVTARDSAGKHSSLTVTFQSDKTPPTIKFGYCLSYNDRERPSLPFYNAPIGAYDWRSPAPPDPDCTAAALEDADPVYVFRSFAELAKAPSTSSRLAFVPEDDGPIATAQPDIIFEASVWRGSKQVGNAARVKARTNESSREVALSSTLFGADFLNVSPRDLLELRVAAVDALGNEVTKTYHFSIDFLPAPLLVTEATPNAASSERVESYTFGAGNVTQLFDPGAGLPVGLLIAKRYNITNPSDRSVALRFAMTPYAQPSASYSEWVGFVVGERLGAGTKTQVQVAPTAAELPPPEVAVPFDCYNSDPAEYLARASLQNAAKVVAVTDGATTCIDSNSLLTEQPVATTSSSWTYRVHTPSGELRFAKNGDYVVEPGETLQVSIGFPKPFFPARTINACVPNFRLTDYVGHTGGRYSMYYELYGYSPETFVAPFGVFSSVRRLGGNSSAATTWDGPGWTDCSGVNCTGPGCRVEGQYEYRLRVAAALGSADYCFVQGCGDSCPYNNCQRQAWREYHEYALSKLTQPYRFSIAGTASISTSSRLTTNPDVSDVLFNLPSETFNVSHSDKSARSVSPAFESVVFTKGTLP